MATKQPEETLNYDEIVSWTITSLKDFLALRGLNQTGRKAELIARAFGAYEFGAPIKFSQEQIYTKVKEEYERRMVKCNIKTDPNTIPDNLWVDDVTQWPEIDDGKLFSYILKVKAVDVEYIGKYKDQKAYSYWMSGFVDCLFVSKCPIDSSIILIKGKVSPSQRIRDDPHKVWVCVKGKQDCSILTSWCTCIAGTSEVCNHVIALLYKINFAYLKQYISPACTSIPQGWNQGTKREVNPSKIGNLHFRKDKKTNADTTSEEQLQQDKMMRKSFDPRKPSDRVICGDQVSILLNKIKENLPYSACVLYSIEHGVDNQLPVPLDKAAIKFAESLGQPHPPLEEIAPLIIQHCQLSTEQINSIEISTRGQFTNKDWFEQRAGRITASKVHDVYTRMKSIIRKPKGKKQYTPLVSSLLSPAKDLSGLAAIAWGVKHEKDGIKSFMSEVACKHTDGIQGIHECGLFVRKGYPYLAASPDGIFKCKCCAPYTVEIKCPYSVRDEDLSERSTYSKLDFIEEFNFLPRLKRTHKYYTQVQLQMWAANLNHSYFVVWTESHKPLIEKITIDDVYLKEVINHVNIFFKTYMLPYLLGLSHIYECPHCEEVVLNDKEIVNPSKEGSICCAGCSTYWHLPCARMSTVDTEIVDSWLCFGCLVDKAKPDNNTGVSKVTDEPPTANEPVTPGVCTVCNLESIPVGGAHRCSLCNNPVHAWCSNHEDITNSADLVCNYCSS